MPDVDEPREDNATPDEPDPAAEPEPGPAAERESGPATEAESGPAAEREASPEETAVLPRSEETTVMPAADETTVMGPPPADVGPTGTTVMPPVREAPSWSGRAEVRPVDRPREPTPTEQWEMGQPATSGFLIPALITISVAILIALIGVGLFALLRGEKPTPAPTATSGPPAPVTTAGPPTQAVTTAPTATEGPQLVAVPVLRRLTEAEAVAQLTGLGLVPEVSRQPSAEIPAGIVITTEPNANIAVPVGSVVRVVVSEGQPVPLTTPPDTAAPTTVTPSPGG
jgi:hypothetical protein